MTFLERWADWKENRRFTVTCEKCGKDFNVKKQSGLCPHVAIEEFVYGKQIPPKVFVFGWDPASGNDVGMKCVFEKQADGTLKLLSSEVIEKDEEKES